MELVELRKNIDRVDNQILSLFLERMELCEQVAEYKREHALPIFNQEREEEILSRMEANAGNRQRDTRRLFSLVMELSRLAQREWLLSERTKKYPLN